MQLDAEGRKMYTAECAEIQENIDALIDKKTVFDDVCGPISKTVHAKVIASNPQLPPTRVLLVAKRCSMHFPLGRGLWFFTRDYCLSWKMKPSLPLCCVMKSPILCYNTPQGSCTKH